LARKVVQRYQTMMSRLSPSKIVDITIGPFKTEAINRLGLWKSKEQVERLWRSLKYECVYLHAWETGSEAKASARK